MASADRDVIGNSDVRFLTPPDSDARLRFGVNDVEDLVGDGRGVNRLKHDEITGGLLDVDNVKQTVIVGYLEGKDLLTQLTVQFLKLYHHLPSVNLHRLFGL
jgi:hypothetical protein